MHEQKRKSYNSYSRRLCTWMVTENIKLPIMRNIQDYFVKLSREYDPSNLWTIRSYIRLYLLVHYKLEIKDDCALIYWLKRNSKDHVALKTKTFILKELQTGWSSLDNHGKDLHLKICTMLMVNGLLRANDFKNIYHKDIFQRDRKIIVQIFGDKIHAKQHCWSFHMMQNEDYSICPVEIMKAYLSHCSEKKCKFQNWHLLLEHWDQHDVHPWKKKEIMCY